MPSGSRLILSTIDDISTAKKLARELVSRRFVACVNIIPSLTSIYRWKDKLEETQEHMLIIKTASDRVAPAMERLRQLHPYEVPEIVVIDIEDGFPAYLQWIVSESRPPE